MPEETTDAQPLQFDAAFWEKLLSLVLANFEATTAREKNLDMLENAGQHLVAIGESYLAFVEKMRATG